MLDMYKEIYCARSESVSKKDFIDKLESRGITTKWDNRKTILFEDGLGHKVRNSMFVTYAIENDGLTITYKAVSDKDTAFNLTNHAYFNLFGQDKPERAMDQELMIPAAAFCPDDAANIPTGELRSVEGTPFDFRSFKPIGRDIGMDYEPLHLQGGYDHNFVNVQPVCAVMRNPENGLTMTVTTDLPGVQLYAGNFLDNQGKGTVYGKRSGVALETQYFPDAVNHPEWVQPFVKAGEPWVSITR